MRVDGVRKIFMLGDLHLGVRNNSMDWAKIQSDYLINHFFKQVDKAGFDPEQDILMQFGDWNHVRESTNIRIWQTSLDIAKKLSDKFKKGIYIILGNHDVYYKDRTDTHSLKGFDLMFPNIKIFEQPEIVTVNGSTKILMLPWVESESGITQIIKDNNSADYVFCHADIKGFDLNSFTKLHHGLDPKDLVNFKKIYSGHIHIRQEKKNMLYLGTPYEMDRGDRGNAKGFYTLDVSKSKHTEEFYPNNVSPNYLKWDITELLSKNLDELTNLFKNNFVDISIDSEFSKKFPLTQFIELVKDLGHRSIEFFPYSKNQITKPSLIEESTSYEYNIFDILSSHLENKDLSKKQCDKIIDSFKSIYDQLKNNKNYD
jgi:hypothetical protein